MDYQCWWYVEPEEVEKGVIDSGGGFCIPDPLLTAHLNPVMFESFFGIYVVLVWAALSDSGGSVLFGRIVRDIVLVAVQALRGVIVFFTMFATRTESTIPIPFSCSLHIRIRMEFLVEKKKLT